MAKLKNKGVLAVFHYIPLHSSPMGIKMGYKEEDLPITEDVSKRLLRLPIYAGMTDEELKYVISVLKGVIDGEIQKHSSINYLTSNQSAKTKNVSEKLMSPTPFYFLARG